jgi:hypothetical protein
MRVLLDSNVWRYIVDFSDIDSLAEAAYQAGVEITVTPAVVNEALRLNDEVLRPNILRALADSRWTRLMPEAFLEADEIKSAIRRLRPHWLIAPPDLTEVSRLREDWERQDGGFWERARHDIPPPFTDEHVRGERETLLAFEEAQQIRKRVNARKLSIANLKLTQVDGIPAADLPGWRGSPVEYWRVPSLHFLFAELSVYASPYREWLDSEINVEKIAANPASLTEMWFYEIVPNDAPRQWLRGAFELLQAFHKVTTGTPTDSALASHLIDVDIVISADRNFIRFAEKCRTDAPFPVALPRQIAGGAAGVNELWTILSQLKASY